MYTQLNGNGRELNCKRYQCEIVKCILAETKPENVKSFHHRILDLFGNMCTNCDYLQYYRFRVCGERDEITHPIPRKIKNEKSTMKTEKSSSEFRFNEASVLYLLK